MSATIENNNEPPPPTYDDIIRNRKKSTISYFSTSSEEKPPLTYQNSERKIQDQKTDSKYSERKTPNDPNAPKDAWLFVLVTVTLVGLVHQLPNSFFGIANEYWMYKFRNVTSNTTDATHRTYLQTNFSALSGMITTVPTVISNFVLTFLAHNIKPQTRVMTTLVVHTFIFGVQVIFINVNTDSWQEGFFMLTMATMVIVMCTISFGAAGQYALITKLPQIYIKGYLLGGGIATLFNATIRLISVVASPSAPVSALIYFGSGFMLLLMSTLLTVLSCKTSFFRHYTSNIEGIKKPNLVRASDVLEVIKYIWSMILLNVVILAIPSGSVSNLVVSENQGMAGNAWANQYFVTVCSYFIPSLTNVFGRALYNKLDWNWPMPAMFALVIFYQIVNTLTIYLSNALPREHLPVLLKHDWQYALAMAIHGIAIGFITNMTNLKSIRIVPPDKTELTMLILYFTNSVIQSAFSPLGMVAVRII